MTSVNDNGNEMLRETESPWKKKFFYLYIFRDYFCSCQIENQADNSEFKGPKQKEF